MSLILCSVALPLNAYLSFVVRKVHGARLLFNQYFSSRDGSVFWRAMLCMPTICSTQNEVPANPRNSPAYMPYFAATCFSLGSWAVLQPPPSASISWTLLVIWLTLRSISVCCCASSEVSAV